MKTILRLLSAPMLALGTAIALILALMLTGCGSSQPKEIIYIDDSQVQEALTNPDAFKGKGIRLTGLVFNKVGSQGGTTTWQAHNDIKNSDDNFAFTVSSDQTIKDDDFVKIDGVITGTFEGTNMFGAKISNAMIEARDVQVISYIDAVAPTISEITPTDGSIDQSGISVTIDKVEFAEEQTRVYVTAANDSGSVVHIYSFSAKLIQNGNQYDQDSSSRYAYRANFPDISSDLQPGASSSGVLVFPPTDSSAPLQIVIEGYSENSNLGRYGSLTFTFDINEPATAVPAGKSEGSATE